MNVKSQEQLYTSLQRGMQAAADLEVAKEILQQRRENLIAQAVADFQARDAVTRRRWFDGNDALLFVAALCENAKLKDDLEAKVRDGRRDGNKLAQM